MLGINCKVKAKRVGIVNIFEFWGLLEERELKNKVGTLKNQLQRYAPPRNALLNAEGIYRMSHSFVPELLRAFPRDTRTGIVANRKETREAFQRAGLPAHCRLLDNIPAAAEFFRQELATREEKRPLLEERRQHLRLQTIQPLHFWFFDRNGRRYDFFAVVTNLSEGGLFAEFIESVSEELFRISARIRSEELPMIRMELFLDFNKMPLYLEGRMIRGDFEGEGLAVEFCETDDKRNRLGKWLERHFSTTGAGLKKSHRNYEEGV